MQKNRLENYKSSISSNEAVVIDFLSEGCLFTEGAYALADKLKIDHFEGRIIPGLDVLDGLLKIPTSKNEDVKTTLYLIAHGIAIRPDVMILADQQTTVPVEQLANALAKYIGDHENVSLNLIICDAAKNNSPNKDDSFAAQLHFKLCQIIGRDVPVVARDVPVRLVHSNNQDRGKKWTLQKGKEKESDELTAQLEQAKLKNDEIEIQKKTRELMSIHRTKQADSKWLFTLDKNGHQIRIDAYIYKKDLRWKEMVLQFLQEMISKNLDRQVLPTIKNWHQIFATKSPDDIYSILRKELASNSAIKPNFFSSLLQQDILSLNVGLNKLIKLRNTIIDQNTAKIPSRTTGNGSPFEEIKPHITKTASTQDLTEISQDPLRNLKGQAFLEAFMAELDQLEEDQELKEEPPLRHNQNFSPSGDK